MLIPDEKLKNERLNQIVSPTEQFHESPEAAKSPTKNREDSPSVQNSERTMSEGLQTGSPVLSGGTRNRAPVPSFQSEKPAEEHAPDVNLQVPGPLPYRMGRTTSAKERSATGGDLLGYSRQGKALNSMRTISEKHEGDNGASQFFNSRSAKDGEPVTTGSGGELLGANPVNDGNGTLGVAQSKVNNRPGMLSPNPPTVSANISVSEKATLPSIPV